MDFFYILYWILFVLLLIFPFGFMHWRDRKGGSYYSPEESPLLTKRANLVESLKDLKLEWETGHLKKEEWDSLSFKLFQDLESIDKQLEVPALVAKPAPSTVEAPLLEKPFQDRVFCFSCGSKLPSPNAKFCPYCGQSQSLGGENQLA